MQPHETQALGSGRVSCRPTSAARSGASCGVVSTRWPPVRPRRLAAWGKGTWRSRACTPWGTSLETGHLLPTVRPSYPCRDRKWSGQRARAPVSARGYRRDDGLSHGRLLARPAPNHLRAALDGLKPCTRPPGRAGGVMQASSLHRRRSSCPLEGIDSKHLPARTGHPLSGRLCGGRRIAWMPSRLWSPHAGRRLADIFATRDMALTRRHDGNV